MKIRQSTSPRQLRKVGKCFESTSTYCIYLEVYPIESLNEAEKEKTVASFSLLESKVFQLEKDLLERDGLLNKAIDEKNEVTSKYNQIRDQIQKRVC